MKLIEIRVVLYVPEMLWELRADLIDKILDFIKQTFPGFSTSVAHSPVTVYIKELPDETRP